MTAEEFERLPESDRKYELNNGVLVEVEAGLAQHELVKSRLNMILAHSLFDTEFVVLPEATNRLGDRIERVPDLGIWRTEDIENMDPERTIVGGPFIAIEIVSSESAADLNERCNSILRGNERRFGRLPPHQDDRNRTARRWQHSSRRARCPAHSRTCAAVEDQSVRCVFHLGHSDSKPSHCANVNESEMILQRAGR